MEQCYGCKSLAERIEQTERALDAEREKVKELKQEGIQLFAWRLALHSLTPGGSEFCAPEACESWVRKSRASQHEHIIEQIKQRRELQAQLATLQAQLRQVEGERDHAKKMEAVQKEVADNQTWHVRQLRQLVEVHTKQLTELTIIPIGCSREQELRWTQSIKDLRAVLAAQDAGKAVSSG